MNREAVFRYEMTEAASVSLLNSTPNFSNPHRSSSTDFRLLSNNDQYGVQGQSISKQQRDSKFRQWLRQARLQLLLFDSWKAKSPLSTNERRKVAIYHSRRMAALHTFFHLIPLGGATVLLVLRLTRHWVGYSAPDSTTLQFVAKFHELLMQFSLVEVLLCVIRTEAIRGFVPIGALSGAVQATQLSYLWSLDFLSVGMSSAIRGWRRVVFVLIIPALIVLTALVGPSSAVLMIPRPGSSEVIWEFTRYLNHSLESLYPSYLDKSHNLTWDFSSFNTTMQIQSIDRNYYSKLSDGTVIFSYLTQGVKGDSRILRYSRSAAGDAANATMPTFWSQDSFWRVQSNGVRINGQGISNGTIGVKVAHPVVHVGCISYSGPRQPESRVPYIQDDGTTGYLSTDLRLIVEQASGPSEQVDNPLRQLFAPVYIQSPEPGSNSLIVVLLEWRAPSGNQTLGSLQKYFEGKEFEPSDDHLHIKTCTVSAYWNFGEVLSILPGLPYIVQTSILSMSTPHKPRPIKLNFTGIDELQGAKFFQRASDTSPHMSACLATVYATVIANVGTSVIFPHRAGGLDSERRPDRDATNSTALTYTATSWGYGYGVESTLTRLALAVLSTYCVIIVAYIVYILVTGTTSTAWNSAIELVALALQSRRPGHLGHTAVGLDSLNTYKEGVGIRVNTDNELELVFSNDRDLASGNLRKIERNKEY